MYVTTIFGVIFRTYNVLMYKRNAYTKSSG